MPSRDIVTDTRRAARRSCRGLALVLTGALTAALAVAQAQEGTGRDGCYFGECDEDQPPRPPRRRSQVPVDEPAYDPDLDYQPSYRPDYYPQPAMPQAARMCFTQYGNCWMIEPIPIGSPCFCPTAFGPIGGIGR